MFFISSASIISLFAVSACLAGVTQCDTYIGEPVYYEFMASRSVQFAITAFNIALLTAAGFICGYKKKLVIPIEFIVLINILKISIIATDFIYDKASSFLWAVYLSPICLISEQLDMLVWIVFDIIIISSTLIGSLLRGAKADWN